MLTSDLIVCHNEAVDLADVARGWEVAGNRILTITSVRMRRTRRVSAWLDEVEQDADFAAEIADARRAIADEDRANGRTGFRTLRLSAGFSQQQLAAAIETTQANISRIERGEQSPSFATAARLRRVLAVSFDELAGALDLA